MSVYFVTRHRGAAEWLRRKGIAAATVDHLDPAQVRQGDVVLGTLPVHVVAALNAKGARFKQLCYDTPVELRGTELSAEDLERLGARLVEYRVEQVD
jgi:CRISPR-associated protein Csx16